MTPIEELTVETDFNEDDRASIQVGLLEHHRSHDKHRNPQTFCVFLRDRDSDIHGGIVATTYWGRMHIDSLWVEESHRGQGWGRRLIEAAEAEAIRRGCRGAHTDTFSWQAPEFYQKVGYTEFAVIEDYPPGNNLHYFRKEFD